MRTYKIWVEDNSPKSGDARNPSIRLMEMEVIVYENKYRGWHDVIPKIPLVAALRQMYPSPDVEIGYCEEVDSSQLKHALKLAVEELETQHKIYGVTRIGELVESLKKRLEPSVCQVIE